MLANVRKTEGFTQTGWGIVDESQSTEKSMVEKEKGAEETEQIQSYKGKEWVERTKTCWVMTVEMELRVRLRRK